MSFFRPTWAEINLKNIKFNFKSIKHILPAGVHTMAVVKANAYGHGSIPVSKTLEAQGVNYLGVATLDEALEIKKRGIKCPILILGSILPQEAEIAAKNNITITLCNIELLKKIEKNRIKTKVHIKVDTGMGRIGVWHEEAIKFVKKVCKVRNIDIEGIYTHFSIAGRDKFFTKYQIKSFADVVKKTEEEGISIKYKHAANSIGLIDWKVSRLNMVRPGIIIYGVYPKKNFSKKITLKPALSLKTRISFIKDVPAGRSVSYGRTYITQKHTKIGTLPIGYADGYGRILSNKAQVLVKGNPANIVGKVTMDQAMMDLDGIKNAKINDEVVLIGRQKHHEIRIEKLARLAGTIPYEILTGITQRVPRHYIV